MTEQITLQKALYTIKKMKKMLQEQHSNSYSPIAIVGLSCRFPQAMGKEAYWQMLCEGKNVISPFPEDRWQLLKGTREEALRVKEYAYWGGYLQNIDKFDPYFFGISPREALRMDPQHRLLLEVAYEAMEDAGLTMSGIAGSNTGVFSSLDISQLAYMQQMDTEMDALYLPTGNAISIAANRLSYLFDLRGPSVIIDSACSSSMTALHMACLNLQTKSCDMALLCGAKLNLLPYVNFVLSKAKMLSADGQCKTFDAAANGYVQGEGIGVVVLKPLEKALKDNDRIYAVIMGSAVNQDGRTNGLTAPNGLQQELLLKTAYKTAGITPDDISYVECHGTGTFLGDPIEIQALGGVVGKNRNAEQPCWIGSVKTNIGHLEPAAGIASIIKVALALHHKTIPPHLNFDTPNPHIAFDKYNFKVPQKLEAWPKYGSYRMAGMSGFGFGGTNAHAVMREIAEQEMSSPVVGAKPANQELFTLSAKDPNALKDLMKKWCLFLEKNPTVDLAALCYNAHVRRSHYACRLAIIVNSTSELHKLLSAATIDPLSKHHNVFIKLEATKPDATKARINLSAADLVAIELTTLATHYMQQVNINWQDYEAHRHYPMMDMPTYAWQHKECWPPLGDVKVTNEVKNSYPLKGIQRPSPLATLQFEFTVDNTAIPDLQDTYNILHAGYYLEILAFAAKHLSQQATFTVENHAFLSPLIVPNNAAITIQLILEKLAADAFNFHFYSNIQGKNSWSEHANGKLLLTASNNKILPSIAELKQRCAINEPAAELYKKVLALGLPAGESVRWTQQYWRNQHEILCEFYQPQYTEKNDLFILNIHPSIVDAAIQPLFKLLPDELKSSYIASSIRCVKFFGMAQGPYYLYGRLDNITENSEKVVGCLYLLNAENHLIAEFEALTLTQFDNKIQIDKIMDAKEKHQKLDLTSLPAEKRKPHIVNFLVEQVAAIFSMPSQDVEINRSLREMGIDSLMALVLMRTLELGLGTTYSMHALLEGPSISELADFVVANAKKVVGEGKPSNPWIAYRDKSAKPKARLFCFPYGGGGASMYCDWQKEFAETIEICPIQLPGRENRLAEKPIANLDELINLLIENLEPEWDVPFAFFGHSMGALIGFEMARALRKRGLPQPFHLFCSAFPDPRTPTRNLDNLLQELQATNFTLSDFASAEAISNLTDAQLAALSKVFSKSGIADYGDYLLDRDIISVLLPVFVGDMSIVKSYRYYDEAPLDLPITVFLSKRDTWVAYEDHLNWADHTQRKCEFREFDGEHLFIKEAEIREQMVAIIQEVMVEHSRLTTDGIVSKMISSNINQARDARTWKEIL